MTDYDNELQGALFKNDSKREGKQDPDYRGNATIGGVEYWVDSWVNEAASGRKYLKLKFRAKEKKAEPAKAEPVQPEFNDDIPF